MTKEEYLEIYKELMFIDFVIKNKRDQTGGRAFGFFRNLQDHERKRNAYVDLLDKVRNDFLRTLMILQAKVPLGIGISINDYQSRKILLLDFVPFKGLLASALCYIYPHLKGSRDLGALVKRLNLEAYDNPKPIKPKPDQKSNSKAKEVKLSVFPKENNVSTTSKVTSTKDSLSNDIKELEELIKKL